MMSGVPRATYDDVKLMLQLYEMRRDERMREARKWFSASFKIKTLDQLTALCPPGSEPNASYRMVTTHWEMVASFMTSGVLSQELFFESGRELLFCWERIRDLVPQIREANKNPIEFRNLETVAQAYIAWWNKLAPGAYQAFSARVRG
jgi:hypothetical protein